MKSNDITKIERLTSQYNTLHNRLERYWKKLVTESLKIAKDRGLETRINEEDIILVSDINIKRKEDNINVDDLIDLASDKYPSLHRKYLSGKIKNEGLYKKLEESYEKLTKQNFS